MNNIFFLIDATFIAASLFMLAAAVRVMIKDKADCAAREQHSRRLATTTR